MSTTITLLQMHMVAAAEADRIETIETVWRTSEGRPALPDQVHKMEAFRAVCRLIDNILADAVIVGRLNNSPRLGAR